MEEKKDYEIKKISKYIWEIPKKGNMKVPVRIFASEKLLKKIQEDQCIQQGINVATLPGIQEKSIMLADSHRGYGFPIGGVAGIDSENGCISPGGIGFDINCGVRLLATNLEHNEVEEKIHQLLESFFKNVPAGVGSKSIFRLTKEELETVLEKGVEWAVEKDYATEEDKNHCEEAGRLEQADASKVSDKAKDRGKNQLGTLGAGNHFLEIQIIDKIFDKEIAKVFGIEKEGQIVVMIHTGSRGLGHQVCSDYLRRMEKESPDIVSSLPDKDLIYAKTGTQTADDYFKAMCCAANFAWTNRQIITYQVRKSFKEIFPKSELKLVYDVCHNVAKLEEYEIKGKKKKLFIHRKGATRAFGPGREELPEVYRKVGQPILIPGSMGTSSYVLVGTEKAKQETFSSTAHGAGRNLSRHQALKEFRGEKIKTDLEKRHIYLKAKSWKGVAEEAPLAYKDIDEIVKVSHETGIGNLVARVIPLGIVKG